MQSDPKAFGTKMHGVLNGPQKMGPEWVVRVLDSTQLTWLNDCYEKKKKKKRKRKKKKNKQQKKISLSHLQKPHL